MAAVARAQGFKRVYVPAEDAPEAAIFPDLEVIPVNSLVELYQHLTGQTVISPQPAGAACSGGSACGGEKPALKN